MAKFKKSLLAIFVAIAAVARAAPIGQFSRPLSFHSLTPVPDKDKGAKRSRSPGLFSRQPPSGSRLPTSHISIGQPPAGLITVYPGALSNTPVQRRDPEPEDEDDMDVRSLGSDISPLLSDVSNVVSDVENFGAHLLSKSVVHLPLEDLSTPAA
jgi:hypothetical protein